jgi:Domain of unknown function (DUF2804), C-terminal
MPLWRGGRPLKRWTWVGAFGPDVMLCAAVARIGPFVSSWWAVWDGARLLERTVRRPLAVTAAGVSIPEISVSAGPGAEIEVVSPHGSQYIWTRKRGGVRVTGTVLGRQVELTGLVDESAGYHARHTTWWWSCGVGTTTSGAAVAWNLVDGVHDAPVGSERTVWIDGVPREVGPVAFGGLRGVGDLRFSAAATRARRDRMLLVSSDYEAPFGTFTGVVPEAGELAAAWGVMERHDARW